MGKTNNYNASAFTIQRRCVSLHREPEIDGAKPACSPDHWRGKMRKFQIAGLFVLAYCLLTVPAFVFAQQAPPPGQAKAESKAAAPKVLHAFVVPLLIPVAEPELIWYFA